MLFFPLSSFTLYLPSILHFLPQFLKIYADNCEQDSAFSTQCKDLKTTVMITPCYFNSSLFSHYLYFFHLSYCTYYCYHLISQVPNTFMFSRVIHCPCHLCFFVFSTCAPYFIMNCFGRSLKLLIQIVSSYRISLGW